jgi:hypothetical protein
MKNKIQFLTALLFSIFASFMISAVAGFDAAQTGVFTSVMTIGGALVSLPQGVLSLTAAGTFTSGALVAILGTAEKIWADNSRKSDYVAECEAAKVIKAKQTARFPEIENTEKDNSIKVAWVQACHEKGAVPADGCVIGGDELQSGSETYTPNLTQHVGFSVDEAKLRGTIFDQNELIAEGLLRAGKELDEWLAQQVIAALNTYAGVNQFADGLASGDDLDQIDPAYWDADLLGEFALVSKLNRMTSPFILDGTNLYKAAWSAKMAQGNDNGKGDDNKFNTMEINSDVFNVALVNSPSKVTYLIDRGAIAFATKSYYKMKPAEYMDQKRFSMPSKNIPGVTYDVFYSTTCVAGAGQAASIMHNFSVYAKAGIFKNPTGCNADQTGVLMFKKETPVFA